MGEEYRDLLYTMQEAGINLRHLMMVVTERLGHEKASIGRIIKEEIMSEMGMAFDPEYPDDLKKAMVTAEPGDDTYPDEAEVSQARQEDLYTVMLKAADELKQGRSQDAYETLLRALAAGGDGADALYGLPGGAR